MRWSPCAFGTRTRTLGSTFDVAENLSCSDRSWYAFDLKPKAVLGRSSTLSNPAFFKIGMPFCNSLFTSAQQIPDLCIQAARSWLSVYTRPPYLLNSCFALPDGPRCRYPAHLSSDEHWSEFWVHCDWHSVLTVQQLCQSWTEVFATGFHVPVPQFVNQVSKWVAVPLFQCAC